MPKVRRVSERRANKAVATVSSAQPATMVLPSLADNPSQMAPQGSPAPVEAPALHDAWCVGSSIVKRAFFSARNRPDGLNLGLTSLGCSLWWQGRGGMRWAEIDRRVAFLLSINNPPKFLIMHCGGNDMGRLSVGDLRFAIIATMRQLACKLPQTRLVWSQILPRPQWQHQGKGKEREVGRKRINSAAGKEVILLGGCYIKYPDIVIDQSALFLPDGVHLSQIGTDIFLNTLSGALRTFITSSDTVYPKQW